MFLPRFSLVARAWFAIACAGTELLAAPPRLPPTEPPPTRLVTYKKVGDRELQLHLFQPPGWKAGGKFPALLAIHGGGWSGGTPAVEYFLSAEMAQRGMVAFSRNRLASGKVEIADCVKDARSAVRYLRAHVAELGLDPDRIAVAGGSAGGHLAAGTALFDEINEATDNLAISPVPNALILRYAVLDTSKEGYGNGRLGTHWRELSPLHRVGAGTPPAILFHGTADTTAPYKGALAFRDAMLAAGNRCDLVTAEGAGHTHVRLDPRLAADAVDRTAVFLHSLGWPINLSQASQ
ncbi:MAG: hypothetical protein QOE70_5326 [Chthoniobacter sp.]|jgi:acetyl esterase/lipase|nr:hypothetical protein [Chthoniobacter sp.]